MYINKCITFVYFYLFLLLRKKKRKIRTTFPCRKLKGNIKRKFFKKIKQAAALQLEKQNSSSSAFLTRKRKRKQKKKKLVWRDKIITLKTHKNYARFRFLFYFLIFTRYHLFSVVETEKLRKFPPKKSFFKKKLNSIFVHNCIPVTTRHFPRRL
jgi:hypothetical protein